MCTEGRVTHLVPDCQDGDMLHFEVIQDRRHSVCLGRCIGMAHIYSVQQETRVADLLQSCAESGHKLSGQLLDESHCVGKESLQQRAQVKSKFSEEKGF